MTDSPLQGMHEHIQDRKGRLTLPSEFRNHLIKDDKVVLSIGFRNALAIWHPDTWAAKTSRENPSDGRTNYSARLLAHATRFIADVDQQARVRISVEMREWCRLGDRDVMVVGNGDHVLVWELNRWKEFMQAERMKQETADGPPVP